MALKGKRKPFKFTFRVLIRIVIFGLLLYLIISYLSKNPSVLGEETPKNNIIISDYLNSAYNLIPEKSRQQLENINQTPAYIFVQDKIEYIKKETEGFPNKQIKEIKKAVVKNVYDDMMNSIESSP